LLILHKTKKITPCDDDKGCWVQVL